VSVRRSRESAPALTVVPDAAPPAVPAADELDEDAVLAAEIEAELAASLLADSAAGSPTGSAADISAEITAAETLVAELDRDIHGGVSAIARREDRWRSSEELTDDELVLAARCGDDGALAELLTKYRAFARVKARSYFLVGADREDIVQEGMIGLYKAIRDFNPDMQSSFRAFAELCVTRQIITAIKTATRQKHGPLNNYVSFSRPVGSDGYGDGDGERVLGDVIPTVAISDPADLVISAERIRALQAHFDEVLSDLETEVLRLYVEGKSYQEIAERLQRHVKSIDNALQRIKRKLEGHLEAREVADAG
jgi:RNA polymerase sporulation-specific sigma factor